MPSTEQIRKWCNGTWLAKANESTEIEFINIDTRNLDTPKNSLFVTIKTGTRDGHSFISDAYQKGIRNFLVAQDIDSISYPNTNFIQVKDTIKALQQIAANHRKQYNIPVIGITGSNGKTIVKEWLYQLLGEEYIAVRSPKSYNSQIGVPLSVWLLNRQHNLGIFEAGISQPGEMEQLEKIIQPTIGVFTNIGEAHSEGFMNNRQKINEKLVLFRNVKHLIFCRDHTQINECIVQYMQLVKGGKTEEPLALFTWSLNQEADLKITLIDKLTGKTTISAIYSNKKISISIPFTDDASIENSIHCWCMMLLLNIDEQAIQTKMALLQPISMRLELRHGINDCTLINDSYNSDITSLKLALNYLDQQKQHRLHTVIMSDILEVGKNDLDLYDEVSALISKHNIQRFIGIGNALHKNKSSFRKNKKLRSIFFKSTDDFLKHFHLLTFDKEAILLKGARIFTFEKIGVLLEHKVHQTVMTIDLSALRHNLDIFRNALKPGVKTMAMVKAFAYGSGSYEIAGLLQNAGVDYLTVAYTDEGISLRKAGIKMPIMVMSPDLTSFDRMIAWKLEPEIYNFRSFEAFTQIANTLQVDSYPIHIKLDTGMHRLGFNFSDIEQLIIKINNCHSVKIASIFSHLAASDNPAQDTFTKHQAQLFIQMSETIIDFLTYKPILHLCNSAAIMQHPDIHFDMVRLGIGLYGIDSNKSVQDNLHQISTLKTTIAQIKNVPKGESIGYGHNTIAMRNTRIATISIGYADGYQRTLGNGNAYVLINGKKAKTIGSICMDMCMIDISHIPEAQEGSEVIIFGKALTVSMLAQWANTIPYEIMTSISQRVKRIYINEE